jgi:hypothetical protein
VVRFLTSLRKAQTAEDFHDLHLDLFGRFLGAQRFLEQLVDEKTALTAALREAKSKGDDARVRALSGEIANTEADRRAARAVLSILRSQGDALAWKLLEFRRSASTVLGEGERVDRLAATEGLRAELATIDEAWANGVLAIHTDITSCLRHGDVLSVVSWEPRQYGLTEVKAGETDEDSPQFERIQRAISLLNEGSHPSAANGGPLEIVRSPVGYRSHVGAVAPLLGRAREESYVTAELEDGLAVEIYDESNPARLTRGDFEARQAAFAAELEWEESDGIIYSTAARRVRDRTHSFSSLAPVPLLPFDVADTSALVMGRLDIITRLNAARLEQRLSERGIEASVARGKSAYDSFLTAERGTASVTVPAHVREQISVELMTLTALIELVDWVLARLEERGESGPTMIVDFADEAAYWTTHQP